MRKLILLPLFSVLLFLGGCSTPMLPVTEAPAAQRYYLDPSIEFQNYRTYGFLQVTAVRYAGETEPPASDPAGQAEWIKHHKDDKPVAAHYTDELIWRVLQDDMARKGYAQVDPSKADLLVVYYGGPRPLTPMSETRCKPNAFDSYFVRNELKPQSFFIDIVAAKQNTLLYRGWDNGTFARRDPEADRVISSIRSCINFFPSRL